MHPGAFEFVGKFATSDAVSVIEIGSRDINGSVRPHFPAADYIGIDLMDGPGVHWVGDAMDYKSTATEDVVLCCEVFEHCSYWGELLNHAATWLKPGGRIIITAGGPGRDPHSAIDGGDLRLDEHYQNIRQAHLAEELHYAGFVSIEVSGNDHWKDTYGTAIKI